MKRWVIWPRSLEKKVDPNPADRCIVPLCGNPSEPSDGPFCPDHEWSDMPGHAEAMARIDTESERWQRTEELGRILDAAEELSSAAAYKLARAAGSVHPCELEGCSLSQEEHHRLAYGILNENRALRKRIAELEGGTS